MSICLTHCTRTGSFSPSPFSFSSCWKRYPSAPRFSPAQLKRQRLARRRCCPVDCSPAAGEARADRPPRSASVHSDPPHSASTPLPPAPAPLAGPRRVLPPSLSLELPLENPNAAPPGSDPPFHWWFSHRLYCHPPYPPSW